MDKWFKSKWFVRALSLAFAISLYIFVSAEDNSAQSDMRFFDSSTETEALTDVPVEIKVDDDNYVVSGVPESVNATVEGAKTAVTKIARQSNFSVFVDLRGLGEGEHAVDIEYENVPSDLSIFVEPKTVDVTIEERDSKEFPISVDFINEDKLADGYELGKAETDPGTTVVTSSKSVIEQIAIVKVFVDVSGTGESITKREVPVNVYDNQGNELHVNTEPENIKVSLDIDNPSKTVPVSVETTGELPDDYELNSVSANMDEVKLFATSDLLESIEDIKTKPIDLSDVKESGTMETELDLPEGALASDNNKKVKVEMIIEQTKTLKDVSIETTNLSDDREITFLNPEQAEADIEIKGNSTDVADLTKDDFKLTIDAKDLDEGEHVVPVSISGPKDGSFTSDPEEVTIELS